MRVRPAASHGSARALLVAIAALGCGLYEAKETAEGTATDYFAALEAGKPELALSFYGSELFEETPEAEMREFVRVLVALGEPESVELVSWRSGISGAGRRVSLVYTVRYPACAITHSLNVRIERGQEARIVGHQTEGLETCRPERATA